MSKSDQTRRMVLGGLGTTLAVPFLGAPAQAQTRRERAQLAAWPGEITNGAQATLVEVRTARPLVALTFDDGPHPTLTPQLLDILAARGVRATFYVIGTRVVRHPQLLQRMVAEGHEIGNHTWSHPNLAGQSDAGLLNQMDRTTDAIAAAIGRPPVTMRPPYGSLRNRQRLLLHQARSLPTVLWSVDPEDWRRPGSSVVSQRIVSRSQPGGVILAHDIHGPTIRAMPAAVDGLLARGFEFTTVSELLGWPRWDTRRFDGVATG